MPRDKLAAIYHKTLSSDQGAPAIDARIVIGAFVVKHKMKLDDRETTKCIRENMYVQSFLGLSNYTTQDVFDRSLFTTLRYHYQISYLLTKLKLTPSISFAYSSPL